LGNFAWRIAMGMDAFIRTDTGKEKYLQHGKAIAAFWLGLVSYCDALADGDIPDYVEWYKNLEVPGELPVGAFSQVFCKSVWHPEAIYGEDEYELYIQHLSLRSDEPVELMNHEAFSEMLERYRSAYAPLEPLIDNVRCIVERLKKVMPPAADAWYAPEYSLDGLEALLRALVDLKQSGVQKACLMIS
jgi:hypothetical protein